MVDDSAYRTDLQEMRKLVERAGEVVTRIGQYLDQIEHRVAAMHVDWTGKAVSAHQDAHRRWLSAAREMHSALGEMRGQTGKAHELYGGVMDHHRGMWPKA